MPVRLDPIARQPVIAFDCMQPAPPKNLVPVQATMETVTKWKSGGNSSAATFSRDEQGRTHVQNGDMVSVHDPVKNESFTLHPPTKIAMPGAPKPAMPSAPGAPSAPAPKIPGLPQFKPPEFKETGDLGEKVINGHTVTGKQSTAQVPGKPPVTQETWTSKDLQLPVHSTTTDHATGMTSVTQMKDIKPGAKLDPAIFKIPAGFKTLKPPEVPKPKV